MNRKAQVKFGETVGILFVVYLVLVFGIMWYNNKNSDDLRELYLQDAQDRSLEKYYFIIYSDLLRTTEEGYEKNSFDLLSMKTFANYSKTQEGKEYLQGRLGEAEITLTLYEGNSVWQGGGESYDELVLYNNSPEFRSNSQILRQQVFTSIIPIKDVTTNSEEVLVGIMRVEVPSYE